MYIKDLYASVVRPVKELKGFKKIELAPNQSQKVEFTITKEQLEFYGKDLVKKAELGTFYVFIGKDSDTENYAQFELI
jgi:beta-glucosidase